jgi:hypothetical protein
MPAICTDPNRRTRFLPETEPPSPFLTGFTGPTGAFFTRDEEGKNDKNKTHINIYSFFY